MKEYLQEVKEFFEFQLKQPFEFQIIQFTPKSFRVIIIIEGKRYESDLVRIRGNHFPHYKVVGWNDEEALERIKQRDNLKNQYCKNNDIKLIRIPYWDYNKINQQYLLDRITNE